MQKLCRAKVVRVSGLMSLALVSSLTLSPAHALSGLDSNSTVSSRTLSLRHTYHLLVSNIVGVAGDRSATVTWSAPAGAYGAQVVAYKVVANYKNPVSNKRFSTPPVVVTDVSNRTATVTGLMNGVWHDFTITAESATEWSAVNTNNVKNGGMVKPSGLPCAASTVNVVAGNKRATVRWNRPCNGGATVMFSVQAYVGSTLVSSKTSIADNHIAPTTVITGLTNGLTYTFVVTSTNVNGSVASASSSEVTPHS